MKNNEPTETDLAAEFDRGFALGVAHCDDGKIDSRGLSLEARKGYGEGWRQRYQDTH